MISALISTRAWLLLRACALKCPTFFLDGRVGMAAERSLRPEDAAKLLEELLPAQSMSYVFGLKLNLALHVVEGIHERYPEPQDRLLHVIIAYLRQDERPTWSAIIEALRSPAVGLQATARRLEEAHVRSVRRRDRDDGRRRRDSSPERRAICRILD